MARTGTLGGGSLSPFGGGGVNFGAFDVGTSADTVKTVSPEQQAALDFSLVRARHDAGQMTDAEFEAAQSAYLSTLSPTTQAGLTASYTIAMEQYTNDRNALAQAVQTGQASPKDLVAFDQAALAAVIPGSQEFYQRQDRLMSSEAQAFQADEAFILDQLGHGYITNAQAQDWYKGQAQLYGDNYAVGQDISAKIGQLTDRINADQDQQVARDWNAGHLTIAQVLAYAANVAAADPNSQRARDLAAFGAQAKDQAVSQSLSFRYDLTREYQQLAAFVASSPSTTTKYSTSHQTRTYIGADGKWHTETTATTKAVKPSVASVAAAAKRAADVTAAKARMKAIAAEVGTTPGGWVTVDDVLAQLRSRQGSVVAGTPEWYTLQKQIDGYTQQKAQDQLLASQGIRVTFPRVGSELAADLTVGALEKPAGWTDAQVAKYQGYQARIDAYQAEIDSGTASPERVAALAAAITTNKGYQAKVAGSVVPGAAAAGPSPRPSGGVAPTVTGGGTAGAGRPGGVGAGGGVPATPTGSTPARAGAPSAAGPLLVVETDVAGNPISHGAAVTKGPTTKVTVNGVSVNTSSYRVSPAGFPVGMSPTAFDDLYNHAVDAVKNGTATFTFNGVSYAIPTNPNDRLAFLGAIDQQNIDLKRALFMATAAKEGVSQTALDAKQKAYSNAVAAAATNKLYVLDSSSPGALKDPKTGRTIKITDYVMDPANKLGYARDIYQVSESYVQTQIAAAQRYASVGDFTNAAKALGLANVEIANRAPVIAKYAAAAARDVQAATVQGAAVPAGLSDELASLLDPGEGYAKVLDGAKGVSAQLFGSFDPQTGVQLTQGALKFNDGAPVLDRNGQAVLNDGWVRTIGTDGKIGLTQQRPTGYSNGKPTYTVNGKVEVQVKTISGYVPVLADYGVGKVGVIMVDGHPVTLQGKLVQVGNETWVENPFQPGQWMPTGATDIVWKAPAGVKPLQVPSGAGLAGVPAGTTGFSWKQGRDEYMVTWDQASGTYNVWARGQVNVGQTGTPVLLGPAATPEGTVDANVAAILHDAGFGIDTGALDANQRSYANLVSSGFQGAWFGTNPDAVSAFLHPKLTNPAIFVRTAAEGRAPGALPSPPIFVRTAAEGRAPGALPTGVQYGGASAYTPTGAAATGSRVGYGEPVYVPALITPTGAAATNTRVGYGEPVTAPKPVVKPVPTGAAATNTRVGYGEPVTVKKPPVVAPPPVKKPATKVVSRPIAS